MLGKLRTEPVLSRLDLVAGPVAAAIEQWSADVPVDTHDVTVGPIDAELADTAEFCVAYGVGLDESANCVIVAGKRGTVVRYAACMVLATTRVDVNGTVRRLLDVRKASFAPMAEAVQSTGMEYGGITPIGLPPQWPILVDARVVAVPHVVIGSGLRRSKIVLPGPAVGVLPHAQVVKDLAGPPR